VTLSSTVDLSRRLLRPIAERIAARLVAKRSDGLLDSLAKHCEETR